MSLADVMCMAGVVGWPAVFAKIPSRRFMKISDGDEEPFDPEYKPKRRARRVRPSKPRMVRLGRTAKMVPVHWLGNEALRLMGDGVVDLQGWAARLGCSYRQAGSASKALRSAGLIEQTPGSRTGRGVRAFYQLTRSGVLRLMEMREAAE